MKAIGLCAKGRGGPAFHRFVAGGGPAPTPKNTNGRPRGTARIVSCDDRKPQAAALDPAMRP
jgi:hypothetical protein